MTTSEMQVKLIDSMGSDKTVVNAARASFNKQDDSTGITEKDKSLLKFLARGYTQDEWDTLANKMRRSNNAEEIQEIMWELRTKATHFAPFCHPQISLRLSVPIAIARQLWKSNVGAVGGDAGYAAWSEESRRYLDEMPEVYMPKTWRKRASTVKQGSGSETVDVPPSMLTGSLTESKWAYKTLLELEVAPEQARFMLQNNIVVSWTWTGSLMFFARVCQLRLDSHAQGETQEVAQQIAGIVSELFPYSWEALMTGNITT